MSGEAPPCTWWAVTMAVIMALSGCIKSTTFNPYANPGRHELDRLQKIVNERPDLETTEQQLVNLDATIRAAIAKYSPQTKFSSLKFAHPPGSCDEPFNRTIGCQANSDHFFGKPAPARQQWLQIVAELAPVFAAAGFHPNNSAPDQPPLPLGATNNSQFRDDGAMINLVNGGSDSPLSYSYDTGCHLPVAWRTVPPPRMMRPGNDPDVHYPYLYGSPGGRNVDDY
jgi:hypothetical protein